MIRSLFRKRPLTFFVALSLLAHCAFLSLAGLPGSFDLTGPVTGGGSLALEIEEAVPAPAAPAAVPAAGVAQSRPRSGQKPSASFPAAAARPTLVAGTAAGNEPDPQHHVPASEPATELPVNTPTPPPEHAPSVSSGAPSAREVLPDNAHKITVNPPLRHAGEFVTARSEQLRYRISMLGVAVGEAQVVATRDKGALRVAMKVTSTPLISQIYPVEDEVSTELVAGNYIIGKVRQREGDFRHHEGFTLMLREKKVFSADFLRGIYRTDTVPREDVTDIMLAFYFLRNQPLRVGESVLLHLYDAGKYAETTVDVLREERIEVAGLGEVDTVVICPRLKTRGIFRRTGEILIWLTADSRKVPVRASTTIPIGSITAELVSSEVEREPEGVQTETVH